VRGKAPRHEAIVNRRELMNKRFVVSLLATLILASVYPAEAGQPKAIASALFSLAVRCLRPLTGFEED
jgi:hypothetical protein